MYFENIPSGLPRARGDGPSSSASSGRMPEASPRTRGWTRVVDCYALLQRGFPAHAGMDPGCVNPCRRRQRLPRARGDGPLAEGARGRRVGASPRTRGWTLVCPLVALVATGFPAHAGMDPSLSRVDSAGKWLPRARGDGPLQLRIRACRYRASPRTRGWTRSVEHHGRTYRGFPAHAGMDPRASVGRRTRRRLPRARGDGPSSTGVPVVVIEASPRTRGWTRYVPGIRRHDAGFPAHAGMDPRADRYPLDHSGLPRARGDGPATKRMPLSLLLASPRTRGWTRYRPTARP